MINRETVDANILLIMAEQFSALSDLNTVDFPVLDLLSEHGVYPL